MKNKTGNFFRNWGFAGLLLAGFVMILQLQSCRNDEYDTSPSLKLEFSADSLLFDTVFTTVGSSTKFFKVYNRNQTRVKISDITLAGLSESYFRINADGRSGTQISDVEIGPRDSLFVYVEVTVDPTGQDLPLVIADSVVFSLNNNVQDVKLVAWGQDANFIRPNYHDTVFDISYHRITENTLWSGPKPYVIYGILWVEPNVTLEIAEGTNVHLHHRSGMIFRPRSSFKVKGSLENPVMIQGDRLEPAYRDIPGQWGYIWLMATSQEHEIDHAIIKNGTYGIVMDSIGSFTEPTLRLSNTLVTGMDQTGLELNGAWVEAENLVVADCGVHAIKMQWGGNYSFKHTTVANYYSWQGAIRQTPSVVINNYFVVEGTVYERPIEQASFANSIIYGSLQEEVLLDFFPDNSQAVFSFDHSLVRTSLNIDMPSHFQNSIFNQNPRFVGTQDNDFRLMEDSPVIGVGSAEIASDVPFDILGNSRAERVDLGAYQYYEIEEEEEE